LAAIGGSYAGIPVLDPLGGLAVSALILKTGGDVMVSSLRELVDGNVSRTILDDVEKAILQAKVWCYPQLYASSYFHSKFLLTFKNDAGCH
jgi:hypothetical protein